MDLKGSFEDIVEAMETEPNKALLWTKVSLDLIFEGACEYRAIPEFHMYAPFTIYLEKGTPYKELFNYQ